MGTKERGKPKLKLNDNEVKEVARMQQMIDSLKAFVLAVSFLVSGNDNIDYPIFARTDLDKHMKRIWRWVKEHKDNK